MQSAIIMGQHPLRIMLIQILPNITGPLLVIMTVDLASAILLEATLSFLGIGLPANSPSLVTRTRQMLRTFIRLATGIQTEKRRYLSQPMTATILL